MPLAPLATVADLEDRLGRSLHEREATRAFRLLSDASAAVRGEAGGQQLTAGTSTVRLWPRGGKLRLPQRPVTAVASVKTVDGADLVFTWAGLDIIELGSIDRFDVEALGPGPFDVEYSHGYAEIPGDLVAVVCQIAGRALSRAPDETGLASMTVGSYQESASVTGAGAAAAAGGVGLLDDERTVVHRYRRVGGASWVL